MLTPWELHVALHDKVGRETQARGVGVHGGVTFQAAELIAWDSHREIFEAHLVPDAPGVSGQSGTEIIPVWAMESRDGGSCGVLARPTRHLTTCRGAAVDEDATGLNPGPVAGDFVGARH